MTTTRDKITAKAALADLLELCKDKPESRWRQPFDAAMSFINRVSVAPAPAPVYECIGKGGEYRLLGHGHAAGLLRDKLRDAGLGEDLKVYVSLGGEVFVRLDGDFADRMRRIR
jgi:hypothetical protein